MSQNSEDLDYIISTSVVSWMVPSPYDALITCHYPCSTHHLKWRTAIMINFFLSSPTMILKTILPLPHFTTTPPCHTPTGLSASFCPASKIMSFN